MEGISDAQLATRRRAIGRRLIRKAGELSVICGDINAAGDKEFLDAKEKERVEKLMGQLRAVGKHFNAMGAKLDP